MKKRVRLAPGALTAPLPPVLVTVGEGERANVITIGWTGILATQPPKTYISVRPTRHSYALLKERGEFVINLPTEKIVREVDYAGIYTGKKVDKFAKTGLTPIASAEVAPPSIDECPVSIECRVCKVVPMGSHDVFVADIVGVSCREDIMDGQGKIRLDRAGLLAYAHGEYFALGEKLGRFGFSTDKKKSGNHPTRVTKKPANKAKPDSNKGKPHGPRAMARRARREKESV